MPTGKKALYCFQFPGVIVVPSGMVCPGSPTQGHRKLTDQAVPLRQAGSAKSVRRIKALVIVPRVRTAWFFFFICSLRRAG